MTDYQAGFISKIIFSKGFGFVQPDDGGLNLFWHCNDLAGHICFDEVKEGQAVRFTTKKDRQGRLVVKELEVVSDPSPLATYTGTVTRLFFDKGFGFIRPDQGEKTLFFHSSGVVDPINFKDLREGERVCYLKLEAKNDRLKAIGVVRE